VSVLDLVVGCGRSDVNSVVNLVQLILSQDSIEPAQRKGDSQGQIADQLLGCLPRSIVKLSVSQESSKVNKAMKHLIGRGLIGAGKSKL
jgi:hypothetical protein